MHSSRELHYLSSRNCLNSSLVLFDRQQEAFQKLCHSVRQHSSAIEESALTDHNKVAKLQLVIDLLMMRMRMSDRMMR